MQLIKKNSFIVPTIILAIYLINLISINYDFIKSYSLDFEFTTIEKNKIINENHMQNVSNYLKERFQNKETFLNEIKKEGLFKIDEFSYLEFQNIFTYQEEILALFKYTYKIKNLTFIEGILINLDKDFMFYICEVE